MSDELSVLIKCEVISWPGSPPATPEGEDFSSVTVG